MAHTLSIYFGPLDGCYDSNNSQNYVATFTKGVYAINTDITGNGTVIVKAGDEEVTSAKAGTELSVILQAAEGHIIYGANVDGVYIDYSTFERQNKGYWVGTITMPASDITIKPVFCKPFSSILVRSEQGKYDVTFSPKIPGTSESVEIGVTVTLTVTPASGYAIEGVRAQKYDSGVYTDIEVTKTDDVTYTFVMPEEEVMVYVDYYKEGGDHAINAGTIDGTLRFYNEDGDPIKAANAGDTVSVKAVPNSTALFNEFYTLLTVTDANGQTVEVNYNTPSSMDTNLPWFTMPANAVTVSAVFKPRIIVSFDYNHGTCTVKVGDKEREYADADEMVTCTVTPGKGYVLGEFVVGYLNKETYETVKLGYTKVDETTYTFTMPSVPVYVSPVFALPLYDNSDNSEAIAELQDEGYANVILSSRTLFKDGNWNTICLPFDMSKGHPPYFTTLFTDATVMELDTTTSSFDSTTGVLTLNFTEVGKEDEEEDEEVLKAGVPYIVKWEKADNIVNPLFAGVYVSSTTPETVITSDEKVNFIGTYSPAALAANDKSNLFLGKGNRLYYPTESDFSVGAFRAYFHVDLGGADAVRSFVLHFGDETNAIEDIQSTGTDSLSRSWYDLSGRKLGKQPAAPGIYVNSGKKIFIK